MLIVDTVRKKFFPKIFTEMNPFEVNAYEYALKDKADTIKGTKGALKSDSFMV
jgi:hypothetical protein